MRVRVLGWVGCTLFVAMPARAQENRANHAWRLRLDNDFFALRARGSPPDYDYTHGTSLSFSSASGPSWLRRVVGKPACKSIIEVTSSCLATTVGIAQEIFTPRRDSTSPIPGERPYAGKLFVTAAANRISDRGGTSGRLEIGVTGKPALAAATQTAIHRVLGNRQQVGWRNELSSHALFALEVLTERRLELGANRFMHVSTAGYAGGLAGNLRTALRAGGSIELESARRGDWRPDSLQHRHPLGWYGVLAIQQEVIAADALITGASSGAVLRRLVTGFHGGLGLRRRRFGVEYRWVVLSPQYRAQPGSHAIGSLTAAVFTR